MVDCCFLASDYVRIIREEIFFPLFFEYMSSIRTHSTNKIMNPAYITKNVKVQEYYSF